MASDVLKFMKGGAVHNVHWDSECHHKRLRKSLSRSLILPQSCNVVNPGEDVPVEFRRRSTDSVKVSAILRRF